MRPHNGKISKEFSYSDIGKKGIDITGDIDVTGDFNVDDLKVAGIATVHGELQALDNVGIGTSNPDPAVGGGNTAKLSVGIVSAYQLYGDGSNLTGLAGFSQDSQANLVAGDGAGAAKDADTCFNIMIGCNSGASLDSGDKNILIGKDSGCSLDSGGCNVILGYLAGIKLTGGKDNVFLGCQLVYFLF